MSYFSHFSFLSFFLLSSIYLFLFISLFLTCIQFSYLLLLFRFLYFIFEIIFIFIIVSSFLRDFSFLFLLFPATSLFSFLQPFLPFDFHHLSLLGTVGISTKVVSPAGRRDSADGNQTNSSLSSFIKSFSVSDGHCNTLRLQAIRKTYSPDHCFSQKPFPLAVHTCQPSFS